ncbi:hypothetical protein BGZ63DRAFT_464431 [Mariannaea sp. PMI_226]|nr:hypothetical protein BGZ63DRAFT_464431 [Mariannaea sp. PMI_226]
MLNVNRSLVLMCDDKAEAGGRGKGESPTDSPPLDSDTGLTVDNDKSPNHGGAGNSKSDLGIPAQYNNFASSPHMASFADVVVLTLWNKDSVLMQLEKPFLHRTLMSNRLSERKLAVNSTARNIVFGDVETQFKGIIIIPSPERVIAAIVDRHYHSLISIVINHYVHPTLFPSHLLAKLRWLEPMPSMPILSQWKLYRAAYQTLKGLHCFPDQAATFDRIVAGRTAFSTLDLLAATIRVEDASYKPGNPEYRDTLAVGQLYGRKLFGDSVEDTGLTDASTQITREEGHVNLGVRREVVLTTFGPRNKDVLSGKNPVISPPVHVLENSLQNFTKSN